MADRYFVEQPITGASATLTRAEAHHLLHVMRAKPGDDVTLFDGSGSQFSARIERCGRSEIELQVVARETVDRELRLSVTLGVALPKGDRQRWLVEKVVELGVARLVPLETRRGVAQPTGVARERLVRAVIEASKQCGRNRLMQIGPGESIGSYLEANRHATLRWIAHPGGTPLCDAIDAARSTFLRSSPTEPTGGAAVAVGPEGGFTDDELTVADAQGWQRVDLGRRILRIETAAALLAGQLATLDACR